MSAEGPFFVVGCPRSGTSLLRNLLRSHSRLAMPPESHFVPAFYRAWGDPADDRAARRLGARILGLHWIRRWELDAGPELFDGCRRYRDVVDRLFGAYARREGRPRWGDKTPGYALQLPVVAAIFPEARFVQIVRDGRDAALSLLEVGFGPGNLYTAARYWQEHVLAARRDGERLGAGRYLEVRYEDVLRATEPTLRRVCEFLGEPFEERVLTLTPVDMDRFVEVFGPRRGRQASLTEVVPGNLDKWRGRMAPADLALFEAVAGPSLRAFGFDVGFGPGGPARRPPGAAARWAWRLASGAGGLAYQFRRRNKRVWVPTELRMRWAALRGTLRSRSATRD